MMLCFNTLAQVANSIASLHFISDIRPCNTPAVKESPPPTRSNISNVYTFDFSNFYPLNKNPSNELLLAELTVLFVDAIYFKFE